DVDGALQRQSRRFLLFVNYMDAHWPYYSPEPYATVFPGSAEEYGPDEYLSHVLAKDASPEYCGVLVARYDSAIAYLDSQLGKFLDALRRRGLYDDALIIITSDHGEAFGERGQLSHGMSVYQNQIRIPLLVKAPGQRTPRVVSTAVSSIDVFDTVLAAC